MLCAAFSDRNNLFKDPCTIEQALVAYETPCYQPFSISLIKQVLPFDMLPGYRYAPRDSLSRIRFILYCRHLEVARKVLNHTLLLMPYKTIPLIRGLWIFQVRATRGPVSNIRNTASPLLFVALSPITQVFSKAIILAPSRLTTEHGARRMVA